MAEVDYEQRAKFARDLPVALNEHELDIYGKQLAEKVKEEDLLKSRKKADSAKWDGLIKGVRQEISRLADARAKGEELRPVLCAERLHGNVIEVVRLDTSAVVDTRPAELSDMQATLPNVDMDATPAPSPSHLHVVPPEPIDPGEPVGEMVTSSSGDTVYVGDTSEPASEQLFDCGACGEKIDPDDETVEREDIGLIHKSCDDEPDAPAAISQRDRDIAQRDAEIAADAAAKPKRERSAKRNRGKRK